MSDRWFRYSVVGHIVQSCGKRVTAPPVGNEYEREQLQQLKTHRSVVSVSAHAILFRRSGDIAANLEAHSVGSGQPPAEAQWRNSR